MLPNYTIVHRQDWFLKENYKADTHKDGMSFLDRSFELHFNERPYLNHFSYLFITKTTKERSRSQSNFSILCRGNIIPKEVRDKDAVSLFLESVDQFERILNDSAFIRLERLTTDEIVGTPQQAGLIEKYFSLSQQDTTTLKDIQMSASEMRIGDDILCVHTLSDVDDLPGSVQTDTRYEKYSTDRSDCRLSFAAPVGLMLSCDHIYNQFLFIDDSAEILQRFEKTARNMHSLSKYSRANQLNKQWIDAYLDEAHSFGLTVIRCHCNVMAWSDNREKLKVIKNDTGSALALMGCKPRYNTIDAPALYWAGIPGGEGDFPSEESFFTFIEQGVCFFTEETNYADSLSPFGIKMADRTNGKPLHLDISDEPMRRGITTNRNKLVIGPSGSGKSFFMNHLVRQYWEQNTHIILIDIGNSYKGLCDLIHQRTNGEDGIYYTYSEKHPIAFNPFFTEDKVFDLEKKESIKTLIMSLWKRDTEVITRAEEVALSMAVNLFLEKIKEDNELVPSFNTFYEFVQGEFRGILEEKHYREKDFDLTNFLNVLAPYYRGGEYDYLLNSDEQLDLLNKRFVVFEIDEIKEHKILFPVVTVIIMEAFINKMRRLHGVRKMIVVEEAWKAIAREGMADYIKFLYKTVRKYYGEAVVVTQELDDIVSSPIIKDTIISNADCKILLDQRKYINKFDSVQSLLGLTDKEKGQILSINQANDPARKYKEVWIGLGGVQSAVYATETSVEEYLTYTTEETEKLEVTQMTEKLGGNMEQAIRVLAKEKKKKK
ncbi:TraG family conjugative transposon ATPase [Bacteroides fragilis]|uniref:TraG family conjugative transposon ATPase n=1 Tax=Bacteroides sp. TaxID=29523 RepID=UPI002A7EBB69|nr:TraG family conjugative transposon ATPase [Bacteroides sp.]